MKERGKKERGKKEERKKERKKERKIKKRNFYVCVCLTHISLHFFSLRMTSFFCNYIMVSSETSYVDDGKFASKQLFDCF